LYAAIDQRLEQQLMSGKLGAPSVLI
jgi:hypothetical protein